MKAINVKLATFTFAAVLLASCSDSTDGLSGGDASKTVVGKEVTSITDAQKLASRVINFNTAPFSATTKARTRSAYTGTAPQVTKLSMPKAPVATGTELNVNKIDGKSGNYIVKSNVTLELANVNNTNIFIENGGELTITNHWSIGDNVNIYVLNGGKFHYQSGNVDYNICIYNGATFDSTKNLNIISGKGIYIEGDWTTTADVENRGNFYIGGDYNGSKFYPGAGTSYFAKDLTLKNDVDADAPLYVGGNLKAQNLCFGSQVYIVGNVNISNNVYKTDTESANVYIGGDLKCGDFQHNQGSTTNVQGENGLDLSKKDITINGTVNFAGSFKANTLKLQGTTNFYACGVETKGEFRIDSNTANLHTGYLKAASIYQCASSHIYLNSNGYIDCSGTYQNENNGVGSVDLVGSGSKALFKANKVKYNGNNDFCLGEAYNNAYFSTCYLFNAETEGSTLYLDVTEFENNGTVLTDMNVVPKSGRNAYWSEISSDYKITDTQCGKTITPTTPDKPTTPEKPGKELTPVSDIVYDHTHNISATCIQPYNGKMYMSYHTRGKGHGACVEVFQTANDATTMLQYLQDKKGVLDFNHLMIDTKPSTPQLYLVGSSNDSGAMLASIDINSNGLLNTEVSEIDENTTINPLNVVPLIKNVQKGSAEAKNDENCIVRDGNKLLIMSTRGYEVYNADDLTLLGSKELPGKAKHIAMNDNKIATLYYESRPGDSLATVKGRIEEFDTGSDILTATPSKTIEVGDIAPNNGKNTIAIDGNYIYVCRSEKGLSCFDRSSGKEVWNWSAPLTAITKVPQGYANGVTFDSNYIYLACGGYGLVVLDKNKKTAEGKPEVVAKKRCSTKNSANYVTLDNGYIYVAYGQSRLQVFKLIDKVVINGNTKYNK